MEYNKMTVLINSFDGYSDIWKYFFTSFNMFWPDCPFPVRLVSNSLSYDNIDIIQTGKEYDWVTRTLFALNQIDTPYIMLLLEDYLLGKRVDEKTISMIYKYAIDNNVNYLRLVEIPRSRFKRSDIFMPIMSNEEYGINLQASIWKVSFLKDILLNIKNGSAWDFEVYLLKKACNSKKSVINGCYTLKKNPLNFHNGVLKGKWFRREIKYFKKKGIIIDYKQRGKLTFFEEQRFIAARFLREHTPYFFRKVLKKLLRIFGFRFVSDE